MRTSSADVDYGKCCLWLCIAGALLWYNAPFYRFALPANPIAQGLFAKLIILVPFALMYSHIPDEKARRVDAAPPSRVEVGVGGLLVGVTLLVWLTPEHYVLHGFMPVFQANVTGDLLLLWLFSWLHGHYRLLRCQRLGLPPRPSTVKFVYFPAWVDMCVVLMVAAYADIPVPVFRFLWPEAAFPSDWLSAATVGQVLVALLLALLLELQELRIADVHSFVAKRIALRLAVVVATVHLWFAYYPFMGAMFPVVGLCSDVVQVAVVVFLVRQYGRTGVAMPGASTVTA